MQRSKAFIKLIIPLLCGLLLGACSKGPTLPPLASDAVILAFGDSLTFGTGAAPAESYPAVLATLINRSVVNAGVPGETTEGGRARLAGILDEVRPALLILCLGGNDFLRRQDEGQVRDNLRAMLRMARERNIDVLLVAVPKLGFGLSIPALYAEIAKEEQIPLEDDSLEEILSTSRLKSDPIHPNVAGYRRMAEALAERLHQAGAL